MTCSTLRRVEPNVTWHLAALYILPNLLQYPQTGRTKCNHTDKYGQHHDHNLQYPQTGRTKCNTLGDGELALRISDLQYPQTGRTKCNFRIFATIRNSMASCSTLRRVEPNVTPTIDDYQDDDKELAVPSDGSNQM